MKKVLIVFLTVLVPSLTSCVSIAEDGSLVFKRPQHKLFSQKKHIVSECVNGKQTTKIYIENPGFENDITGSPHYWKYGISKGWGIESDPTYLQDPQKGAGVFNIKHHKVITFNTENTGDNVGFLHRGTVRIKQTLDYALKPNAIYQLNALIGRRVDIPFGSYRLALYAGNELLVKTDSPVPVEGEFVNVQLIAKTTKKTMSIGRPIKIELINTSTTSKNHYKKTQVVTDNFELYEEVPCSPDPVKIK